MTESEAQDFVARYAAVWAAGISDDFRTVWDEDGMLNHPMLDRPLKGRDVPTLHRMQKAAAPTLIWRVAGWTWREDIVVVEWLCTTAAANGPFAWRGMDKFRVRDGKIIEETVYSDTAPLRAARRGEAVEPMMRFPILADCTAGD
ncbi:MAG TPA: nuclear transport factor 2 family protein [Rhodopila sp.]